LHVVSPVRLYLCVGRAIDQVTGCCKILLQWLIRAALCHFDLKTFNLIMILTTLSIGGNSDLKTTKRSARAYRSYGQPSIGPRQVINQTAACSDNVLPNNNQFELEKSNPSRILITKVETRGGQLHCARFTSDQQLRRRISR